jgi:hypothetical protein
MIMIHFIEFNTSSFLSFSSVISSSEVNLTPLLIIRLHAFISPHEQNETLACWIFSSVYIEFEMAFLA